MKRWALVLAGVFVLGLVFGGAGIAQFGPAAKPRSVACRSDAKAMARLELVFGLNRRYGDTVSEQEWTDFLDSEITPRFPNGLTVLSGPGQWLGNDGALAKESSKLLVIWHVPGAKSNADIETIRDAYVKRFDQDSVMRVDGVSCVSF